MCVDDLPHGMGTMYDAGDPGVEQFKAFDLDGDGTLSRDEVVGRLCGEFGVTHELFASPLNRSRHLDHFGSLFPDVDGFFGSKATLGKKCCTSTSNTGLDSTQAWGMLISSTTSNVKL